MRRFLTPRWLVRHLVMIMLVAGCLWLGWWQIGRAVGGNALSFGYAVEWPVFALFVIFVWSREVRAERRPASPPEPVAANQAVSSEALLTEVPTRPRAAEASDAAVDDDPRLRSYNEYLAWLGADPGRRPADYPGGAA